MIMLIDGFKLVPGDIVEHQNTDKDLILIISVWSDEKRTYFLCHTCDKLIQWEFAIDRSCYWNAEVVSKL